MDCKLYPYTRKDIAGIQELKQYLGWHITAFNVPETWSFTDGEGVTIAVIDTGCDLDNPDIAPNLLEGINYVSPGKPYDDNDHGTHITATICSLDHNGVVGIAPKAKVMPIKVLDQDGFGEIKNVAKGIRYAVENNVDMICLSLGTTRPFGILRKAIKKAAAKGIPCFCAGGNISKLQDALYPARYPETIAIAALDKEFHRADFSNTSKYNIDFLAPGVDILSTIRHGWYALFSGSSMAVPFAASCAALVLSAKRLHSINIPLDTVGDYRQAFRHGIGNRYSGEEIYKGFGIIEPGLLVEWMRKE